MIGGAIGFCSAVVGLLAYFGVNFIEDRPQPSGPTASVEIPTFYDRLPSPGRAIPIVSPTLFTGRTGLAAREELWALLRPPRDPAASTAADRRGLYKLADNAKIAVDSQARWSVKIDIGRGPCDEGKTYDVVIVRSKPSAATDFRSRIAMAVERRSYPEFADIPDDSKPVGHVRVLLLDYRGEHHSCG